MDFEVGASVDTEEGIRRTPGSRTRSELLASGPRWPLASADAAAAAPAAAAERAIADLGCRGPCWAASLSRLPQMPTRA